MARLNLFVEHISCFSGLISGILIFCMAFIVFMEVALRYIFNQPTIYTLDVVSGLVLACVFIGGSYTHLMDGHVSIGLVVGRLPPRLQRFLRFVNNVFVLLFTGVFAWQAFTVMWRSILYNWRSDSIVFSYPFWPLFLIMGLGLLFFCFQAIAKIGQSVSLLRLGNKETSDDRSR